MKWLDQFSIFEKILYFIFFPLVALGAIVSPLTNDVRIFYGVEYLDWKYLPNFPSNILGFWEIKPVFNHCVNYFLVVVTNFFIPFSNHFAQEIFIKSIALTLAIFACWMFSKNVLKIKYSFILCLFSIYCSLNLNILQAEWWATIFVMISCALFMEENHNWSYVAGALLIPAFLVKGTTGALMVSAVCVVMIFQRSIDWKRGLVGFVAMGAAFFIASQTVWQTMLSDIFLAPILSHVGEYNWFGMVYVTAVAIVISFSIYIPAIGIGAVYSGVWFKNHIRDPRALYFVGLWTAPLCMVFLQSESFAYQYFIFLIPAIVSLVLYEKETPLTKPGKKLKRENLIAATIVILFVMWCFLYSPLGKYGHEEHDKNSYFWNESAQINQQFNFGNQSVLYLDTGSGPYYFSANSSCRYPAPLVLQRANPGRLMISNLSQYWDEYDCVMNYSSYGNYIVADGVIGPGDSWFGNDSAEKQNIIKMIRTNFSDVHSGGWEVYQRKVLIP